MAEIKISDLSIGDWVRHTFYEENLQIKRIDGESERLLVEKGLMSVSCHLDHFEPIPLTPEILEKNGFTRWVQGSNKGDYYLDSPRTKRVWLYYDFGTYKMAYIRNTGGCETFFKCRDIASVHQLQHALRLAGVEKEIEV